MSSQTMPGRAPREHSLGYAVAGGAVITLISMLIGGGLFAWILLATRGPSAGELLPVDTQLYAALAPNVGGVVDVNQLQRALREGFGISDPAALLEPVEALAGVPLEGNIGTWLGSEMIVAVRGVDAGSLQGVSDSTAFLNDAEVVLLFGSKNDPQSSAFLEKHRTAREARGETFQATTIGEVTIYAQEGGAPSLITAFALVDHYVIFSNRREAIEAMVAVEPGVSTNQLASLPEFRTFSAQLTPQRAGAVYTDGTANGEAARQGMSALLQSMIAP